MFLEISIKTISTILSFLHTENLASSVEESGESSSTHAEFSPKINEPNPTGNIDTNNSVSPQQPTYINPQGVRFTTVEEEDTEGINLVYGMRL